MEHPQHTPSPCPVVTLLSDADNPAEQLNTS